MRNVKGIGGELFLKMYTDHTLRRVWVEGGFIFACQGGEQGCRGDTYRGKGVSGGTRVGLEG